MDSFTLKLSATATDDLDPFDDKAVRIILKKMAMLKGNPFPMWKLIEKIKGKKSTFYLKRKFPLSFTVKMA